MVSEATHPGTEQVTFGRMEAGQGVSRTMAGQRFHIRLFGVQFWPWALPLSILSENQIDGPHGGERESNRFLQSSSSLKAWIATGLMAKQRKQVKF